MTLTVTSSSTVVILWHAYIAIWITSLYNIINYYVLEFQHLNHFTYKMIIIEDKLLAEKIFHINFHINFSV